MCTAAAATADAAAVYDVEHSTARVGAIRLDRSPPLVGEGVWRSCHHRRLCRRLRLRCDRRATGAVNALDCVDERGIAGATTTEDPVTTTSKQSVGLQGQGGDDDDNFDPRGDGDNDTTISLAMATATRAAGDEEGDGGKSDDNDTPTNLAMATATRSGGR